MVWENVPGAFSSNFKDGFGDFGAVLEEAVRIAEPGFSLPRLPDKQKWTKAGGMLAEDPGAHEVVADSGRESRPEVQPDAESVRRDSPEGRTAREETAGGAENCSAYAVRIRGGCDGGGKGALVQTEKSGTLGTGNDQTIFCLQGNGIDRADTAGCNGKGWKEDISYTLNTIDRPAVCTATVLDMSHACDVIRDCGGISPSLQARMGTGGNQVPLTYQMQGFGDYREGNVASNCKQRDFKGGTDLVCAVDCRNFREGGEINGTLQAKESGGQSLNLNNTVRQNMVVRRLTPLECTRLQGFPDGWVDIGDWTDEKGRVHKEADAPKHKALGNSIALPFWRWMFGRMAAYLPEGATLGSLFDGIGGFPLCWESIHGAGSARWASEIEEFPIAVTKHHFEESNNK